MSRVDVFEMQSTDSRWKISSWVRITRCL